jgi:hypothetical protein
MMTDSTHPAVGATASREARRPSAISGTTWIVSIVLLGLLAVYYYFDYQAFWLEAYGDFGYNLVYVSGLMFNVAAFAIMMWVAWGFEKGETLRRVWVLMALGVGMYAIGDFIWTYIELVQGLDPYPSVADLFYMLEYPFFVAAMGIAISSYRKIVNLTGPIVIGLFVGVAAIVGIYFVLLEPYIFAEEADFTYTFVSAGYPVFDILFMAVPALILALTVGRLGAGRWAWPWWIVALGGFVFAITDAYYSYVDWAGLDYHPILDIGWYGSSVLLAIAALVARDVYRTD